MIEHVVGYLLCSMLNEYIRCRGVDRGVRCVVRTAFERVIVMSRVRVYFQA
jgi:hypothetical protein